ncbi:MAG: hypothetical protein EOO73_33385 [Myxococcales bacterium]|nr:MAG: hypothetical protein EOO73_33385 [Myxococcales bacterium]
MGTPPSLSKVAIIGSGCAAMTTAFELTRPEHGGRYEVTVYQQGFRLGGKGASSRGPAGRIEEHGLHVWLGFYENAFRLMRECYAELGRDPDECPIASWRQAFEPASHVGIVDWSEAAGWEAWTAIFPPLPGEPGDDFTRDNPYTVTGYVVRMLEVLRALLEAATQQLGPTGEKERTPLQKLTTLLRYAGLAALTGAAEVTALLDQLARGRAADVQAPLSALLERLQQALVRERSKLVTGSDDARRVWEIIDLVLAIFRGLVQSGTFLDPRGLDALDDYDIRDWLARYGASAPSLASGFVRGLYDLAFAFEAGDIARPGIAAGQALRGALRFFFTYRGALFWKMRAGMGETIFAPLYEVLTRRGVRFEFFHRLENVRLSGDDQPHVVALELDVQARVLGPQYLPLVHFGGLPCFPAEPDFAQLEQGELLRREGRDFESHWDRRRAGQKRLEVGRDFDFVVLGVGVASLPHICSEILARDSRWRSMCEQVKTVATQAGQAWLAEDMTELGWSLPAVTLSGFVEPFDTWADMSHLLPLELWPVQGREPRSLAYFCSVLADEAPPPARPPPGQWVDYAAEQRALVRRNLGDFLERHVHHLWPRARTEEGFRWQLLVAPDPAQDAALRGRDRLESQYVSANVSPSDRFTLTLPGSTRYRLSPLDATYDNLTIVGDYTACGFNESCVEAAVMSGRLGAHAIAQWPRLEAIVGYDHP